VARADSGLYGAAFTGACRRAGAHFSVTARMDPAVKAAITSIPDDAWTPVRYSRAIWDDQLRCWVSDAEVAETGYTAFASKKGQAITARLIVRRVRDLNRKAAPDAVMLTARAKPRGTATVVMSHRYRSLVLTTAGLAPLPAGHRYQLWLMGPSGDRPAGLLPAPHGGMTSPVIATGLAAGDWIGLTVAPEGGSPHPASTPVLMLNLTT
jgi:anti-sigma-K factor RskA